MLISSAPASADSDTCADRTIVASAVRTTEDVQAFVQCAYEFVGEVGFEEARRAFNEDERWKSGPTYGLRRRNDGCARGLPRHRLSAPDPSLEGVPWGVLTDDFGSDLILEFYRVATNFGEGWVYYSFTNPCHRQSRAQGLLLQGHRLERDVGCHRGGDLSPRPARQLPERRGQFRHARLLSLRGEAAGVCPLRRHGAGFHGVFRLGQPGQRSPLEKRLRLPVRPGHLWLHPCLQARPPTP